MNIYNFLGFPVDNNLLLLIFPFSLETLDFLLELLFALRETYLAIFAVF